MSRRGTIATLAGVTLITSSLVLATPVSGNTLVVSNTFDHGPGSLRDAIVSAAPGDTIQVSVSGVITLTGGPLAVRTNLSIVGPGAANLTLVGSGSSRVITIESGTTVSIAAVTISNGHGDYGGGILNGGRTTLTDCVVSSNAATMFGGAIFNSGTLTLARSLVSNNFAEYRAGAIYSETGSTLTLDHATLSGNSSSVGGAIDNHDATLLINASTLSGNVANGVHGGAGGAIHDGGLGIGLVSIVGSTIDSNVAVWDGGGIYTGGGRVIIENSTIANNTSTCDFGGCSGGGGIHSNSSPVSINSSTFANNTSRSGGNIMSLYTITTVRNSIFVAGASGANCYTYFNTSIVSNGNNISDDASCAEFFTQAGDLNGVAAGLSPNGLQGNGGSTLTIALLATSPAVDRVPFDACVADGLTTDQRGAPRPSGDACDSGAFELTLYPTTLTLGAVNPASLTAGSPGPVTVTAALMQRDSAAPVAGAAIAWSVDGVAAAVTTSGTDGVATLSYDPSLLAAGDHTVRATFARQTILDVAYDASASAVGSFHLDPSPYAAIVQPPIRADGTSVFKSNRGVVPVKFTLTYSGANTCDLVPATIGLFKTAGIAVGPVTLSTYPLAADSGPNFKVDATACQYVYNLSTDSLASGTYAVKILIGGAIVGGGTFGMQ
ncbi:MAG TPA: choice-of-anchor Q domain-containing protein [Vicinamibacterales bacterium]|nr:choice-of-anchor Q domain-containing protein [Vicinamibacterales bacterium]